MPQFTVLRPGQATSKVPLVTGTSFVGKNLTDTVSLGDLLKIISFPPNKLPPTQFPPATAPPPPAGTPVSLQLLLAGIPIAADGDVITSEYHNSLRNAILAMAQLMGAGLGSTSTSTTLAPTFVRPFDTPLGWEVTQTGARQAGATAFGWMPIQLPHGERLQSMTVYGNKGAAVTDLTITLARCKLDDASQAATPLITVSAKDGTGPIKASDVVKLNSTFGATAALALLDDFKQVDNDTYKYLITARLAGAGETTAVQLSAIQVNCGFS